MHVSVCNVYNCYNVVNMPRNSVAVSPGCGNSVTTYQAKPSPEATIAELLKVGRKGHCNAI